MKVLFRKLKRTNKFVLTIFVITLLIYIVGLINISISIFSLSGIETLIRIIGFALLAFWLLVYLFTGLAKLIKRKYKLLVLFTIISLLLSAGFFVGSYYINYFYNTIGELTESDKVNYTSYLISMKDSKFNKKSVIGMITDKDDIEGNILAKKIIKKNKLKNEIKDYDGYEELIYDLYNGEIDAIFVSSNYKTLFSNDEEYSNIANDTKVIYELSELRKNEDKEIISDKSLDEPFTLLVMGVDSEKNGLNANAAFNGDTLIMITFNPNTLTASMFSIPRDTFVPIACRNGAYAKINSSAAYGTSCVIDTVTDFTGINIDYYVKVNFKGVVELVEAVGGIEVEVEPPDYKYNAGVDCKGMVCEQNSNRDWDEHTVFVPTGFQKLNGEQALAYSRCRHLYTSSDLARNRHQQDVISALGKKALKFDDFNEVKRILKAISNNIATNMSEKQILSSYEILKNMLEKSLNDEEMIDIKKTYLEVYSLPVNTGRTITSALGYREGSLKEITKMMKQNLGKEEKEMIKTFSYDFNEAYESKIYGKGITSGNTLELLPNFIGSDISKVKLWGENNGISIIVDGTGNTVISQSLPAGYLVKNMKSLKIVTASSTIDNDNSIDNNDDDTEKISDN